MLLRLRDSGLSVADIVRPIMVPSFSACGLGLVAAWAWVVVVASGDVEVVKVEAILLESIARWWILVPREAVSRARRPSRTRRGFPFPLSCRERGLLSVRPCRRLLSGLAVPTWRPDSLLRTVGVRNRVQSLGGGEKPRKVTLLLMEVVDGDIASVPAIFVFCSDERRGP